MDNTIDEAHHHLESWARAYGSDDAYPVFRERLERGGLLPGRLARLEPLALRVYDAGPLAQRGLIVLTDPQPPAYPVLAELTQWVTGSSLLALRSWSVAFGVLAVWLAYRVGRDACEPAMGLWFAALLGGAALSQWYSGIGRPYAFAQAMLLLAVWAFVHQFHRPGEVKRWRWMLLAALGAQLAQWVIWPVVGLLLLAGFVSARCGGVAWKPILKPLVWYVPASLLLCGYLAVQLLNPTVSTQAGAASWAVVLRDVAIASPFAQVGGVTTDGIDRGLLFGGWLFIALVFIGAVAMLWVAVGWLHGDGASPRNASTEAKCLPGLSVTLLAAALVSVLIAVLVNSQWRFQLTLALLPMLVAAWGLRKVCLTPTVSCVITSLYAVSVLSLTLLSPLPRYEVMWTETRYTQVAATLSAELGPDDRWSAYPYFFAAPTYRYADLPEPVLLTTADKLKAWLVDKTSASGGRSLLLTQDFWRPEMPALPGAREVARFPNGYVLLELP